MGNGGDMTLPVGVYLPGTAGNYVSTPNHASLIVSTSIDVRFAAALDWQNTSYYSVVSNFSHPTGFHFRKQNSAGILGFVTSNTGFYFATAAVSFANGDTGAVRCLASTSDVAFYERSDIENIESDSGWTQVGAAKGSGLTFNDSSQALMVGSSPAGSSWPFLGTIYQAYIKVDGTLVAEFNPLLPVEPRYRDVTGKIWTMNGSAFAWEGT
jgi:hypothetical protein